MESVAFYLRLSSTYSSTLPQRLKEIEDVVNMGFDWG